MISRLWEEYKLGDLVDISSSKRIFAKEYCDNGIPFYRGKEIIEKFKGNDVSTELFISEERYKEIKDKFGTPIKGDILLSSVGTLGVPYYVDGHEFYFKDGNLTWLKNYKEFCYSEFIYYWIQSNYAIHQIYSRAIGSTQKALTIDTLKKFDITLPPLDEQKGIVKILSDLDNKIETNNKINKKLEEMAQAIFKQWFVDFEFPNEDGEPYKSSGGEMVESELGKIPNSWNVITLGDYIEVKHGYAFKSKYFSDSETDNILLTPGNFKIGGGFYDKKFKYYLNDGEIKKEYILKENDLIITMTDLSKDGDTLGYPAVVPEIRGKTLLHNQRLGKIEVSNKEITKEFIYYLMCNPYYRHHILATATGTTVRHTAPKRVADYKFTMPNDSKLVNKFTCLCRDVIEKNNEIISENRSLVEIRDTLLPKLMSGEIRVPLD